MTRLIYDKQSNTFGYQDKFLWFWVDKTAVNKLGDSLPCYLKGFNTIEEAISEAQSDFYMHKSCLYFLLLSKIKTCEGCIYEPKDTINRTNKCWQCSRFFNDNFKET